MALLIGNDRSGKRHALLMSNHCIDAIHFVKRMSRS